MEFPDRKVYSVSELTEEIKRSLEKSYPAVWVQGEISNYRPAPSGHLYFTLKDETAQMRCVMFKTQSRFLKFRPEDGLQVICWGRISVYSPRGEYQLILDTMEPLGIGSLMLAFEQLRKKLADEGLFDEITKKALPSFPKTVGLVTSRRGAAVRDIVRIIERRAPGTNILLSSASVQGDRAPEEIVSALQRLVQTREPEVIIIGRGGGSIEDLWAFNDERVVRAVAACPLPIVSAVGHETDFTLTDFAADVRASTPSAAAEIVVPDRRDMLERVTQLGARIKHALGAQLEMLHEMVNKTAKRLYDPRRKIQDRRQRLDELSIRLTSGMRRALVISGRNVSVTSQRLKPEHLKRNILLSAKECERLWQRLNRCAYDSLSDSRIALEKLTVNLESLSPLGVLSRGYSVTMKLSNGQTGDLEVVRDAKSVHKGELLKVRLHKGELECEVTDTRTAEER